MVQMPPEMDPNEPSGERTVAQILAQLRANLRLDEARVKQIHAELKTSLDGLNGKSQPDKPTYAKILEAVAKLQADVTRPLEKLAELQARFPPSPPLDAAEPPI